VIRTEAKVAQHSHLSRRSDRQYLRFWQPEIARFSRICGADKDRFRIAFPSRTVNRRARVRRKPCRNQRPSPETLEKGEPKYSSTSCFIRDSR
jgi:hypothetical protein